MLSRVPLFVPGGPELLVVLFLLVLFIVPVGIIAFVAYYLTRGRGDSDRTYRSVRDADTALEHRVDTLERQITDLQARIDHLEKRDD